MCLHINLKYDRTDIIENTGTGDTMKEKIYICEICKKEFTVERRLS